MLCVALTTIKKTKENWMARFELSHLTQPQNEAMMGPIQDSEALLLYAVIRVTLARKVVELGGLKGYSAKNFSVALGPEGVVFTVDVRDVPVVADNHRVIKGDVGKVKMADFGEGAFDLIFMDCHSLNASKLFIERAEGAGLVDSNTIIALHDTNLHPGKSGGGPRVHQPVERMLVNWLSGLGWDAVCLHTLPSRHSHALPFRHGLTLMKRFEELQTTPTRLE